MPHASPETQPAGLGKPAFRQVEGHQNLPLRRKSGQRLWRNQMENPSPPVQPHRFGRNLPNICRPFENDPAGDARRVELLA